MSGAARPRVAIVGGGLAGLAAAVPLAERGLKVEIYEARRSLGGRAASFRDPATGELVDHCQHVSMGCCTNLADFCRRTGLDAAFRRDRVLHFFTADGTRADLAASRWLPAPLHLGPALMGLRYLSLRDKLGIARAMWRLARTELADEAAGPTMLTWLQAHGQSPAAIERFWSVVLVSALGETLDRAGVPLARKVFLDGFLRSREAYEVLVPLFPLRELLNERLTPWLSRHHVDVRLGAAVEELAGAGGRVTHLRLADGTKHEVDAAVLAVPWRRAASFVREPSLVERLPELAAVERIEDSPIAGVHLWFDRLITPLPHAVLVGTLGQWLFNRGSSAAVNASGSVADGHDREHYYQVVISASRTLAGRDRAAVIEELLAELGAIFPVARGARLLRWRLVSEQAAVFSAAPGIERLRPPQRTSVPNFALAGDWTRTGWPSTMESAVRSGYLAAEAVLTALGRPERLLAADIPAAWLARRLFPDSRRESSPPAGS